MLSVFDCSSSVYPMAWSWKDSGCTEDRILVKPRTHTAHGKCNHHSIFHIHPPLLRNSRFPVKWLWYSWHISTNSRTTTQITLVFLAAIAIAIAPLSWGRFYTYERESCPSSLISRKFDFPPLALQIGALPPSLSERWLVTDASPLLSAMRLMRGRSRGGREGLAPHVHTKPQHIPTYATSM